MIEHLRLTNLIKRTSRLKLKQFILKRAIETCKFSHDSQILFKKLNLRSGNLLDNLRSRDVLNRLGGGVHNNFNRFLLLPVTYKKQYFDEKIAILELQKRFLYRFG